MTEQQRERHTFIMLNPNRQIEQLLRPPVEMTSGLIYFMAAVITVLAPSTMIAAVTTPVIIFSLSLLFIWRGFYLCSNALRLLKYQYELLVLPKYEIASTGIPFSKKHLFLGRGFEWRVKHTQRKVDLDRAEFRYIKERDQTTRYQLARSLERITKKFILTRAIAWALSQKHYLNPVAPIPYVEGRPEIHAVGLYEGEDEVSIHQSERVAHTFVVGTTRVGKTRLAEILVTQDIHNDEVVIVFDPKGDADLLKRMYVESKKAGRLDQFKVFHLGYPEISARYNPVGSFMRVTEPASRIAGQLPSEGNSAAFREFTWRYVNVISKALTVLGKRISYDLLLTYGSDIDPLLYDYLQYLFKQPSYAEALNSRGIQNVDKAILEIVENTNLKPDKAQASRDRKTWAATQLYAQLSKVDIVAHSLIKTFEYDKSFYDRLVASLFPLLEKLTSGPTAELLSPDYNNMDDPRPIFDWNEVINTGGIVYIGLDALSDADVAQAVGNSMFADLTSTAGGIYKFGVSSGIPTHIIDKLKSRKICIHADEFNELVGKEFIPMANKAGGANFQLTVYTQTLSDIIARFGDTARAGQVVGNLGTMIMMRVKEAATAELLTNRLPQVEVNHLTFDTGANDDVNIESDIDFSSSTRLRKTTQRVPLLEINDVDALPKGQAFVMMGGKLSKVRIPQLNDDHTLPKNLDFLTRNMREQYRSGSANDQWYKTATVDFNWDGVE